MDPGKLIHEEEKAGQCGAGKGKGKERERLETEGQ